MNQRFQHEEIRNVSEQYAENELYKAISTIGPQLESELAEFGLCPEECFMEALELLSAIAEKGEDIMSEIDNIWLRKHNEYKRLERQVSEDEIRKAVGIVFGFTVLALDSSHHPFYRYTLTERLTQVVANHQFSCWASTLDRIFSVPLSDGWFDGFIDEEPEEESLSLPKAINTERAQKYFRKAIEKEYMKLKDGKFYWVGVGGTGRKSQLAYFLGLVYGYRHSESGNTGIEFPNDILNALFGETKLYDLLVQVHVAQKKQKWRPLIDELFE